MGIKTTNPLPGAGELRRLFEAYVVAKQRDHVLDYDDLLLYWRHAMAEPAVATEIRGCFDHVLVDEYQDTNRLQAEILMALRPDGSGLTIVGDDAQSIYSFRAATVRNILDFPHHFSPTNQLGSKRRLPHSIATKGSPSSRAHRDPALYRVGILEKRWAREISPSKPQFENELSRFRPGNRRL